MPRQPPDLPGILIAIVASIIFWVVIIYGLSTLVKGLI